MKHLESSEIHENAFTGGLNECIEEIKRLAAEQDVPVFYVMNRWNIGKSILRKVPVSIVGVMNYDGTDVSNIIRYDFSLRAPTQSSSSSG